VAHEDDPECAVRGAWLSEADAFYRSVDAVRYVLLLDELRVRRRSA
jgi:hypothetical protein